MSRGGLTEDMIGEYQETFSIFDNRGDQKVHVWQIGEVLRACGQNPTEAEWKKYMGEDQERRINFNEFLPVLKEVAKNRDTSQPEDFIEGFKVFDKEQNGTIGTAELRHLLSTLGEKMTEEECEQLFQGQEDSQGNINYEDFVHHVLHQ
ncbi:myosin-2 essential light chain-like isoform X2 [Watersipora subatra]|uniref:myosin-2 essential light chain-like isoform X2 n=1 Tax=Watersipora subatra TaxID=2589382 RepID=UPI00355C7856